MPGLFGIYEVSRRSLLASQSALNTVGHNIANAATRGFRRQRVAFETTPPVRDLFGTIGTGVNVQSLKRVENRFVEFAILREAPVLAGFTARSEVLAQAEATFGEPSEGGLTTILDDFYDAWDDLASSPEDAGVRESVVRHGVTLASALSSSRNRISRQIDAVNGEVRSTLDDVNRVMNQLAQTNQHILVAENAKAIPPDLEDRRDLLVETLAELVGATGRIGDDGTAVVWVDERIVVQGNRAEELTFDTSAARQNVPLGLSGSNIRPEEVGGRIGGLFRARDEDLGSALRRIDELAVRLAQDVNAIHATGVDAHGRPAGAFFVLAGVGRDGVTRAAEGFTVAQPLLDDATLVAAGRSAAPGDGSLALDVAALRNDPIGAAGMLQTLVVDLGARSREAQDLTEGQQLVVDSYLAQRESISGVSLDEEGALLLRFQRSYEASARLLSAADEMVRTILNI